MSAPRLVLLSNLLALSLPALHGADESVSSTPPPAVDATPRSPRWQQIDPLLDESIAALVAGQAGIAEKARQKALHISSIQGASHIPPDDVLAAHAERAIRANQPDAAIIDYSEALHSSRRSDLRFALASLLIARNRADEAVDPLTEIFRTAPEYGRSQQLLGKIHLVLYEKNKSLDELADATLALNPPTRSAKTALTPEGEIALKSLEAALKKLSPNQHIALTAARKAHRLTRARALIEADDTTEALPLLNEVLAQDPACAEAYELRAQASDNDPIRKRIDLQIAAELRAPAPEIPAQGDEFTLALAQANLHVHQRPYEIRPYLERINVRGSLRPTPELAAAVLKDAQFARDLDPDDPEAVSMLAEAFYFLERTILLGADGSGFKESDDAKKAAIANADIAVALAPQEIDLLVWRAGMERKAGPGIDEQSAARAMLLLNRAIQASPTNLSALSARAQAARKIENYTLATDDYRTLIRLQPGELVYSYNLAWVLMDAEKFRASAKAFAASIGGENVPDDAPSLQALALAFAGDPKSEELAAAIPEHSIYASGMGTASWNIGHNKGHTSPLIQRVLARLQTAQR